MCVRPNAPMQMSPTSLITRPRISWLKLRILYLSSWAIFSQTRYPGSHPHSSWPGQHHALDCYLDFSLSWEHWQPQMSFALKLIPVFPLKLKVDMTPPLLQPSGVVKDLVQRLHIPGGVLQWAMRHDCLAQVVQKVPIMGTSYWIDTNVV